MTLKTILALAALAGCGLLASQASAAPITVPNGGFEAPNPNQYGVPTDWVEDQPRALSGAGFASSGTITGASSGLLPSEGNQMARVSIIGDSDAGTSFTASISNAAALGQYQANTIYTLTVDVARNSYVGSNQWIVVSGLRANGTAVATYDGDIKSVVPSAAEDTFYPVSVTVDTSAMPSVVGQDITVFLGWRHQDNYNKSLFFDNVRLDASPVPEPASLGLLGLGGLALLRRRR